VAEVALVVVVAVVAMVAGVLAVFVGVKVTGAVAVAGGGAVAFVMRPRMWPAKWDELATACGGIDAFAASLHTSRSVVTRWALGRSAPSGPSRVAIAMLAQMHGLPSPV
jgi:hypothetical protein